MQFRSSFLFDVHFQSFEAKIIEGQREEFERIVKNYKLDLLTYHHTMMSGTDLEQETMKVQVEKSNLEIFNWHKQSIIQILQSEIERKRGMKKEYTESFHVDEVEKNQAVKYKNHGEVGFNRCLKEDIAHLSVLLDSLK